MTLVMQFILFVRVVSAEKHASSRAAADASVPRRIIITGGRGSVPASLRAGTEPCPPNKHRESQSGGRVSVPAVLRIVRDVGCIAEFFTGRGRRGRRPSHITTPIFIREGGSPHPPCYRMSTTLGSPKNYSQVTVGGTPTLPYNNANIHSGGRVSAPAVLRIVRDVGFIAEFFTGRGRRGRRPS